MSAWEVALFLAPTAFTSYLAWSVDRHLARYVAMAEREAKARALAEDAADRLGGFTSRYEHQCLAVCTKGHWVGKSGVTPGPGTCQHAGCTAAVGQLVWTEFQSEVKV